jgi:hypothetical protein
MGVPMVTTFSGWLFNLILWGAIISGGLLVYERFVGPVLNQNNGLIALGACVVLAALRPRL